MNMKKIASLVVLGTLLTCASAQEPSATATGTVTITNAMSDYVTLTDDTTTIEITAPDQPASGDPQELVYFNSSGSDMKKITIALDDAASLPASVTLEAKEETDDSWVQVTADGPADLIASIPGGQGEQSASVEFRATATAWFDDTATSDVTVVYTIAASIP